MLILQKCVVRVMAKADTRPLQTIVHRIKNTNFNQFAYIWPGNAHSKKSSVTNIPKHSFNTQNKDNAAIGFLHLLIKALNRHFVLPIKIYNTLEPMIIYYPFWKFKKLLYQWLTENPLYSFDEFYNVENILF